MPSYIQAPDGSMIEIDDLVIDQSGELREPQNRGVIVQGPETVVKLMSTINGSVSVEDGASVDLEGTVNGSVHVAAGSTFVVQGKLKGSVHIAHGAKMHISERGLLAGSIHCDGELVNDGTRDVAESGSGSIIDGPTGSIRQPNRVDPDGTKIYNW